MRYLIRVTSTATANHPLYAGQIRISYIGIGGYVTEIYNENEENMERIKRDAKILGYKRKCDAGRNYVYKRVKEENGEEVRCFVRSAEIIEIDV